MGDEPNVASTWFPVSDHPQDKARYTFRVSVPKGLGVVANGTLKYHLDIGGHSLWVWDEPLPMASYLVTADIGRWIVRQGRTPGGIPEYVAVDPVLPDVTTTERGVTKTRTRGRLLLRVIRRAADLWTQKFGPYPFDVVGRDRRQRHLQRHAARLLARDADQAGVLGRALQQHDRPRARAPVVRRQRLALTPGTTSGSTRASRRFAEFLWAEYTGLRTAHEQFLLDFDAVPRRARSGSIVVSDPQRDTMFASAVYRRGGMTLQALREKIANDDTFFRILKTWTAKYRYGTATTEHFIALSERVSGLDLANFFHVWLDVPQKPTVW